MRFGVIQNAGSGDNLILLSVLNVFRKMQLRPVFAPLGTKTVYHYMADPDLLKKEPNDENLKLVAMIRDPRDVVSLAHTFQHWFDNLTFQVKAESWFDVLWVRYEELITNPGVMQDAIGNWLGYEFLYDYNFVNTWREIDELDLPHVNDMMLEVFSDELRYQESVIGKWRKNKTMKNLLLQQVNKYPLLVEWVEKLGYEEDNSWLNTL